MLAVKRAKTKQVSILWTEDDKKEILNLHEDAVMIKANVTSKEFNRILMASGSSMDILFKSTLYEMGIVDLRLEHTNTSLKEFGRGKLMPLGVMELLMTIGLRPFEKIVILDSLMIEENSPYQMIFGRPFLWISKLVMS